MVKSNLHAYLYLRIKESSKVSVISIKDLKEILNRALIRSSGGVPRFLITYVIEDLVNLGLLGRIHPRSYKILESNCDQRIKNLMAFYI